MSNTKILVSFLYCLFVLMLFNPFIVWIVSGSWLLGSHIQEFINNPEKWVGFLGFSYSYYIIWRRQQEWVAKRYPQVYTAAMQMISRF